MEYEDVWFLRLGLEASKALVISCCKPVFQLLTSFSIAPQYVFLTKQNEKETT